MQELREAPELSQSHCLEGPGILRCEVCQAPSPQLPGSAMHQKRQMIPTSNQQPENPPARLVMHPLGPPWAAGRWLPLKPQLPVLQVQGCAVE